MRQRLRTWLVLILLLGWNCPLSAQEDPRSIIDKAIKAHGAADQLAKCQAVLIKAKGTLEIMGGLGFTSEAAGQLSGQIKEVTDVDVNGQKIAVITVFNGTKGWIKSAGQTIDMNEKMVDAMKEAAYHMSLNRLV